MRKLALVLGVMVFALGLVAGPDPARAQGQPPAEAVAKWRDLGFGMFIHWGPVSLTGHEIGWSRGRQTPIEKYDKLYKRFNPKQFDAEAWAQTAKEAGMKYLVITTKHHDGFCLWPSDETDYDIASTPYKKDVIAALAEACRERGIKFGTYYSVCDWYHPEFPRGSPAGNTKKPDADLDQYTKYLRNQVTELIENYDPFVMWFDVPQVVGAKRGIPTVEMVRDLSPDILINNRAYRGFKGDFRTPEQHVGSFNRSHPWETCMTIATQWAWKPNDKMKSLKQCVRTLLRTVGGDGNLLFNVGPRPDGRIHPPQAERLREMGDWLEKYGAGVYNTRGGPFKPGKWGVSTCKDNKIYLYVMQWPDNGDSLTLPLPGRQLAKARTLSPGEAKVSKGEATINIELAPKHHQPIASVIELTVEGDALDIEPRGVPQNRSLSYQRPAKASNVYEGQTDQFGPAKAVDGKTNTRWATDAEATTPSLEITFDKPTTIARIAIDEAYAGRIQKHALQYRRDGQWHTAYTAGQVGENYEKQFDPVTTKRVRLKVLDATKGPTLREVYLYGPGEK
jgi:alpha-L-fucosidase